MKTSHASALGRLGTGKTVNPCRCSHEKADHQMRIGQRGNYTPCGVSGCRCDGFRKSSGRLGTGKTSDADALIQQWRDRARRAFQSAVHAHTESERVANSAIGNTILECASELERLLEPR